MGTKIHGQKGNNPDRQLRSLIIAKWERRWRFTNNQEVGLEAIGYAIYASGLTVTRYGVQPALPDRKLLELYRDEIYLKYNILKSED